MKVKMKHTLIAFATLMFSTSAFAATTPGSFDVNTDVKGSCVLVSADNIDFGTYDPAGGSNFDIRHGSISVRCTAGTTNVSIALDQGANPGPGSSCDLPARRLKSSNGQYLRYFIGSDDYVTTTDFLHSTVKNNWGCTSTGEYATSSTKTIESFSSSLEPVVLPVPAKIYLGQDVGIGSYSDTIGVTVTF